MSPEQVRAEELDPRTDLFAFGSVMYEMATGDMAFSGSSNGVVFEAILNRMPTPVGDLNPAIPEKLNDLILKSLEKEREMRYQTAAELRGDLKRVKRGLESSRIRAASASGIAAVSGTSVPARPVERNLVPRSRVWTAAGVVGALALLAGLGAGPLVLRRGGGKTEFAAYHPLTFRRGIVHSARFAPDGKTVIYSAAWEGKPLDLYTTRPESPQSQLLEPKGADVLAVSASGEMLLALHSKPRDSSFLYAGTLARVPLVGGAPREILNDVEWADWSPDGTNVAIVHDVAARKRLEFPLGKVLYEADGWIGNPRVAPDGKSVAFVDHPQTGGRRWGRGGGGSGGEEDEAVGWMGQHTGAGLVAGRERNLVYGHAYRRRPVDVCDGPNGESAVAGAGAGRVDAAGCGKEGMCCSHGATIARA